MTFTNTCLYLIRMGFYEFVTLIMKKNRKRWERLLEDQKEERHKETGGINTVSDITVRQVCCRLTSLQQPGLSETDLQDKEENEVWKYGSIDGK